MNFSRFSTLGIANWAYCEYTLWLLHYSLILLYFVSKMLLRRSYPFDVDGNLSIHKRTPGSFRFENLVNLRTSELSISILNCPQNRCQPVYCPLTALQLLGCGFPWFWFSANCFWHRNPNDVQITLVRTFVLLQTVCIVHVLSILLRFSVRHIWSPFSN